MLRNLVRLWKLFPGIMLDYDGYIRWVDAGGVVLAGFPEGIRTGRVYEHPTSNKWMTEFTWLARFSISRDTFSEKFARFTDAPSQVRRVLQRRRGAGQRASA